MFSDASLTGVCTVAYAVVNQQNMFSQNVRLARKKLSILRLKLVAGHIPANLAESVTKIYACSDSTTVLHWLKDNGKYKIFVSNRVCGRVSKIKGKVLSNGNCEICKLDNKWLEGPKWLQD